MNANHLNSLLIVASAAIAYVIPFELLLLSYAVLGPAHYLTQISWMYDRRYFTARSPHLFFTACAILSFIGVLYLPLATWAVGSAILATLYFAYRGTKYREMLLLGATLAFSALLLWSQAQWSLFVLAIPTVIHVFVFTAAFMVAGALRSGRKDAWLSCVLLFGTATAFFLVPHVRVYVLDEWVERSIWFGPTAEYIRLQFNMVADERSYYTITGFLAFAYTYHYLNWFTKVEIIGWHKNLRHRLLPILALYILAVGCYFYDYRLGLSVLLTLSLLHVLLELPLNMKTFAYIGQRMAAVKN